MTCPRLLRSVEEFAMLEFQYTRTACHPHGRRHFAPPYAEVARASHRAVSILWVTI
jgi:hypothetical protein